MTFFSRRIGAFLAVACMVLAGTAFAVDFEQLDAFPSAAASSYGIVMTASPDGRLLVWDGWTIWEQAFLGGDRFAEVAQGYLGDPGFMALSPDGHRLVLGAGYSGAVHILDLDAPADYEADSEILVTGHYSGVMVSENLLLVDRLADDYATTELAIVNISADPASVVTVMAKPPASDFNGGAGEFAVSTALAVDDAKTAVYTTGLLYDATFATLSAQLKRVAVSDLMTAYNAKTQLDWHTDAVAIGADLAFNVGGPSAVMANGDLLLGGFGGVQRVNPDTGTVVETYAPAGFDYYGVSHNPVTDDVYPVVADPVTWAMDVVYGPAGAIAALPAMGGTVLVFLAASFLALGRRRL